MGDVLQAVVLGLVQGLTEFIPVSSSAHLVLVPALLGWNQPSLAFGVAMHFGTFASVLVYFRTELTAMARSFVGADNSPDALTYRHLGLLIVAASIPVAVTGLLLEDAVSAVASRPVVVALLLLGTAGLLVGGERLRARRAVGEAQFVATGARDHERVDGRARRHEGHLPVGVDSSDPAGITLQGMDLGQALRIGVAQCLALLPGISRSGTTIAVGMAAGLTRPAATRFSFLLSLPALVGAGLLSIDELARPGAYSGLAIAAGVVAAFASGYLAIRFLVALVARTSLAGFAWYCVAASAVGVAGTSLTA